MNLGKILYIVFGLIWTVLVIAQQIAWICQGSYNFIALIWAAIELCLPYLVYQSIKKED